MSSFNKKIITVITWLFFITSLPLAAWVALHIGTKCTPTVCVIPVFFFGVYAPSGVVLIGLALISRDILQRLTNVKFVFFSIVLGTILCYFTVSKEIALGSIIAYIISELSNTAIYTMLQRYSFIIAVIISVLCGAFIDSIIFLEVSFHSHQLLLGQFMGKVDTLIITLPLIIFLRRVIK
jgi:uncharacterized PurR-regulated membrane protein YhhQ (DUF165 family)